MKKINRPTALKYLSIFAVSLLITACATSPTTSNGEKTSLSSSEKSSYQNALNSITSGEPDKAVSELKKITTSHPSFLGGWINLTTAYYNSKKIDEASAALENAKKIQSSSPEIFNLSGLIDVEKGQYQSAEKNYQSAIALKNDYAPAHYNLALVYDVFYQDIEKAIPQYEQYLTLTGNTDKNTISWVAELKSKLKRRGNQ